MNEIKEKNIADFIMDLQCLIINHGIVMQVHIPPDSIGIELWFEKIDTDQKCAVGLQECVELNAYDIKVNSFYYGLEEDYE